MKFSLFKYILLLLFTHLSINCLGQDSTYVIEHYPKKISLNLYTGLGLDLKNGQVGIGFTYAFLRDHSLELSLGFNYESTYRISEHQERASMITSHVFRRTTIGHRVHFPLNAIIFMGKRSKIYVGLGFHPGYFMAETNTKFEYEYSSSFFGTSIVSPSPVFINAINSDQDKPIQEVNNLKWKIVNDLYFSVGYNTKKSRFELFIKSDFNGKYKTIFSGIKYRTYLRFY